MLAEQTGIASDASAVADAQLTKARILLGKEGYQEALESARSAHRIYQMLNLATGIAETNILEAEIILAAGGDRKEAINLLVEVIKTRGKEGLEGMRKKAGSMLRKMRSER